MGFIFVENNILLNINSNGIVKLILNGMALKIYNKRGVCLADLVLHSLKRNYEQNKVKNERFVNYVHRKFYELDLDVQADMCPPPLYYGYKYGLRKRNNVSHHSRKLN